MEANKPVEVNASTFRKGLEIRMSPFNAKIILDSAFVSSGIVLTEENLDKTQAQTLCLSLIKKGGPAFHVGTEIYKTYLQ
jgi:hypothetical protein